MNHLGLRWMWSDDDHEVLQLPDAHRVSGGQQRLGRAFGGPQGHRRHMHRSYALLLRSWNRRSRKESGGSHSWLSSRRLWTIRRIWSEQISSTCLGGSAMTMREAATLN